MKLPGAVLAEQHNHCAGLLQILSLSAAAGSVSVAHLSGFHYIMQGCLSETTFPQQVDGRPGAWRGGTDVLGCGGLHLVARQEQALRSKRGWHAAGCRPVSHLCELLIQSRLGPSQLQHADQLHK